MLVDPNFSFFDMPIGVNILLKWYPNLYTSCLASSVSIHMGDMHPEMCLIHVKFGLFVFVQCYMDHFCYGWVLIFCTFFFFFLYLDGYGFKALGGTPIWYIFLCIWNLISTALKMSKGIPRPNVLGKKLLYLDRISHLDLETLEKHGRV